VNRRLLFECLAALVALPESAFTDPRTDAERRAGIREVNPVHPVGDVRRYGAVGDGVHDDSTAIQAALAVGAIKLPPGVFHLGKPLTFKAGDRIDMTRGAWLEYQGGKMGLGTIEMRRAT